MCSLAVLSAANVQCIAALMLREILIRYMNSYHLRATMAPDGLVCTCIFKHLVTARTRVAQG